MYPINTIFILGAMISSLLVVADVPFNFCTDSTCSDCPASVTSDGTGYPACVVYDSGTVFAAGDFNGSDGGGYEVYLDVPEPSDGCATIIKSPAGTTLDGCGTTLGAYSHATCSVQELKETFMVQFCCGTDDCSAAAGLKTRGLDRKRSSFSGGLFLKDKDGNEIAPIEVGKPTNIREAKERNAVSGLVSEPKYPLRKRVSCSSWTVDGDRGGYTKPADAVQIVVTSVNGGTGGASVQVTTTRESSFTSTVEAGVDLEIFSAGASFSYEESVSSSESVSEPVPAGSVGKLGFTPTLKCTSGTLVCDDGTTTGEACTGYMEAGDVAGTYAVIETT